MGISWKELDMLKRKTRVKGFCGGWVLGRGFSVRRSFLLRVEVEMR